MNGIPKTERIWTHIITKSGEYYITSKESRDYYYIYRLDGDRAVKLGKSRSPADLEKSYAA